MNECLCRPSSTRRPHDRIEGRRYRATINLTGLIRLAGATDNAVQEWRRMMRGHCPRPVSAVHDAATWKERAKWARWPVGDCLLVAPLHEFPVTVDQIERSPCAGAVASSSSEEFVAPCSHSLIIDSDPELEASTYAPPLLSFCSLLLCTTSGRVPSPSEILGA